MTYFVIFINESSGCVTATNNSQFHGFLVHFLLCTSSLNVACCTDDLRTFMVTYNNMQLQEEGCDLEVYHECP